MNSSERISDERVCMAFRVAERLLDSLVGVASPWGEGPPEEAVVRQAGVYARDVALLRESYRAGRVSAPCALRKLEGVIDALSALSSELASRSARA